MCDDGTIRDAEDHLRRSGNVTRRGFGALSAGAGLAMLLPRAADALTVTARNVAIPTPDGTADCHFVHPSAGAHPGVLIWPDALGLRPAFEQMAQAARRIGLRGAGGQPLTTARRRRRSCRRAPRSGTRRRARWSSP